MVSDGFHGAARLSPLTRRQLLQVGGLGMVGLTLPRLLQANSASASRSGDEKSCIFIVQYGGAPHQDSFDLKPEAPSDIAGPYRPIATTVPGFQICEKLPRLAKLAKHYSLIRSMTHGDGGHDGGMHICMTGNSRPKPNTPYFGSVVAKLRPATRNLPSYVWVQNLAGDVQPRYETGGFLGAAYSPVRVGKDLDNPSAPGFRFKAFDPASGLSLQRLAERRQLLERFEPTQSLAPGATADTRRVQEEAFELLTGHDAQQAFDLAREPRDLRERYGMHPLGQNLLMARRLIEAGVRLVSVVAWTGIPAGAKFSNVQTWDMHGGGLGGIFGEGPYGLGWALPRVDEAVSALLEDLVGRDLLRRTLVVMVGEFGRTPKINNGAGRDHWPNCYTALVAGAGIRGGAIYGASDRQAGLVKTNPVSPEDFGATIYTALGIPPATLFGPDGISGRVSTGEAVSALFA
jgi:uncharacterized protein (DUF1501 family)